MHDINRTQLEGNWETGLAGESMYESEMYPETYGETFESSYGETAGPLGEAEEMELAAQLQELTNEQELDRFIGNIFNSVKRAVGSVIPPAVRNQLGGMLKGVAKSVLPMAGAALGNFVVPGLGGMVGGKLASMAGQAFGLELEGMSAEDQEFEIARRYVRLVSDAAQEATFAPPTAPPQVVAQQALRAAAEKHAPGLVSGNVGQSLNQGPQAQQMQGQYGQGRQSTMQQMNGSRGRSGRWVRRGRTVILLGL